VTGTERPTGVYLRMVANAQEWLAARQSPNAKPILKYTACTQAGSVLALSVMYVENVVRSKLLRDTGLHRCRSWFCPEDEMLPCRLALAFYKDASHSLEIAIAIQIIGLQVTGFRPLVPAVEGDQGRLLRMRVNIRLRLL
jgi:hypothetical protein